MKKILFYMIALSLFFWGSTGYCDVPPVNDNFADAILLTGNSGQALGSNVGATKEAGEPDHAGKAGGTSVWWRWQATNDVAVSFNTFDSGVTSDTLLAVYTGTDVSHLTLIAQNDNYHSLPSVVNSELAFSAIAGQTYYIAVDGNVGATFDIVLNFQPTNRITGRVTNELGQGIKSIVYLYEYPSVVLPNYVVSDTEGNYEFLNNSQGSYWIFFEAPGYLNNGTEYIGEYYNDKANIDEADLISIPMSNLTIDLTGIDAVLAFKYSRADLLATWDGQGVFWRNSETGVWAKIASAAARMTAGDLDNDGIDDPVAIWPGQNGIFVRNSSTGAWIKLSSAGDDVACGDINGDGRSDLLATWSGQGLYWRNSATGIWTKIASPATRLAAGDIDGDGKADAVAIWPGQNGIFVRYSSTLAWSKVSSAAADIACGDINGDDRTDLLATWSGQGLYYRNSLSGVWAKLASPATAVSAGDIDGDGIDDAVAVWPAQSGIFIRYSSTSSWTKIASAAADVACGKLRGASGMISQMLGCMNGQQFGRYDENAEVGRYLDISFSDPFNLPGAVLDLSHTDPLHAPEKVIEESSADPWEDPEDEARRLPGPGEDGYESEKDPGTAMTQIEEKG